jgi:hypothetical protein
MENEKYTEIKPDSIIEKRLNEIEKEFKEKNEIVLKSIKENIYFIRIQEIINLFKSERKKRIADYVKVDFEKYIKDIKYRIYYNDKKISWLSKILKTTPQNLHVLFTKGDKIFNKQKFLMCLKIKEILGVDINDYIEDKDNEQNA